MLGRRVFPLEERVVGGRGRGCEGRFSRLRKAERNRGLGRVLGNCGSAKYVLYLAAYEIHPKNGMRRMGIGWEGLECGGLTLSR